jgi:DNA-binding transcriptional MerR regulator
MMTIGEVPALTALPVATVRYYERRRLIPEPPRSVSGYRQYSPDVVDRLRFVKRAQALGFALEEIGDCWTFASKTGLHTKRSRREPARSWLTCEVESRRSDAWKRCSKISLLPAGRGRPPRNVRCSIRSPRWVRMRSPILASVGGVSAAFLGALCCAGPLLFVFFGVGAGLASTFDPLRPLFTALMLGAFGFGFYTVYGRRRPAATAMAGATCAVPRRRTSDEFLLWSATAIAAVLWSLPYGLTLFI